MSAADVSNVNIIADRIHSNLPERPEVFAEKQRLSPETCLTLWKGPNIVGYGIAHPWRLFEIPPLDSFLEQLPVDANCLYLHDVAILPEARGGRAAALLTDLLRVRARLLRLSHLACVSVYGTDRLWSRVGYVTVSSPEIDAKLASYGEDAKYMVADV